MKLTIKSSNRQIRKVILGAINRKAASRFTEKIRQDARLPVFVIASQPEYYLAPLTIQQDLPGVQHVVLANGVSQSGLNWLRSQCGNVPIIPLRASLRGNSQNFLSHAEVISIAASIAECDFCIQDADCFVTDRRWWDHITGEHSDVYAAGPFGKPFNDLQAQFPDTFLVRINRQNYIDGCRRFRIGPDITVSPSPAVRSELSRRGIRSEWFPDHNKQYYDTLQQYWTAATLSGLTFRLLPGADLQVFHIGGSSYLTKNAIDDPAHWDYWAVNTTYCHLKILESPRFVDMRSDVSDFLDRFESSDHVLATYPAYADSARYRNCSNLLESLRERLG